MSTRRETGSCLLIPSDFCVFSGRSEKASMHASCVCVASLCVMDVKDGTADLISVLLPFPPCGPLNS